MTLDRSLIGRRYGPFRYHVGLEKLREYALAVAGVEPGIGGWREPTPGLAPPHVAADSVHGAGEIVAMPMFPVVVAIGAFASALEDPALGADLATLVHGEQDLELLLPIRPGDVLFTTATLADLVERGGLGIIVVVTESCDAGGQLVARARWTAVWTVRNEIGAKPPDER